MMTRRNTVSRLIDRLPAVRGRYKEAVPLSRITWFAVGGPADVMFKPADETDLADFLAARPDGVPITVIGVGSNLLVRDGGIPGVVVRLGRNFAGIAVDGTVVDAGAAALDVNVARTCAASGLAGLEFLSGVPGTIGGALRMNAGAYGTDMAAVTASARALDPGGVSRQISHADLGFSYRSSSLPKDWIVTAVSLHGDRDDPSRVNERIDAIAKARQESQPVRARTGGSTFMNPPGHQAWELIEKAGCRGLRRGGAVVSEKHCNFLVNDGSATAADIEALGEEIRRRVAETSGISLEWEIRRIGRHLAAIQEIAK